MNIARQIEALYKSSFAGPFPYQDCFWVAGQAKVDTADLIPELDWYFGTVAGYASSATRLGARPAEELMKAEKILSKEFFECFPQLECCLPFISSEETPDLHRRLQVVN